MTCPSALTLSRHGDGNLPPEEAAHVERHVAGCAACRESVAALADESRALRAALRAAEAKGEIPAFVPRPTIPRLLSWLGWGALTVWTVNLAWMSLTAAAAVPPWLGWLAPDAAGLLVDLTIGLALGFAGDGLDLLGGAVRSAGYVALGVVGTVGLWFVARRRLARPASACLPLAATLAILAAAAPSQAFEVRRAEDRVTIAADETVDDTLVIMAEDIRVEGTVTGNLVALGEQVTVRGNVGGMLVAAAEVLRVEGGVGGTVLTLAETVELRDKPLGGDVYALAETVTLHADTGVAGNVALGVRDAELHGSVGKDVLVLAEHLSLLGRVDRNVRAYAGRVTLASTATVGGNLRARVRSEDRLEVAPGATVTGDTNLDTWPEEPSRYATFEYYLGEVLKLVAAFVTGLVLFHLFPGLRRTRLAGGTEFLTAAGLGAVALVATPVLAVVVTFTLIGAPLGILAFLVWLAGAYLAGIVVAGHVGRLLLDGEARGPALPLLAGLLILFVLVNVPVLGAIVRLVAMVIGLGLIVQWLRGAWLARAAQA